ncbi:MAG: ribosomal protein S18-alanine N-acetyltransferase [Alphaproteobacteria bacterium]|nr:ribosomal protein S18-alanine N-acetyltransferase [Alphaproteobacteria bacterium]
METRLAIAADATHLAALHGESFGLSRWNFVQICDSLFLPTTHGLVAEEDGAINGFILCQISGGEAEILTFCVAAAARRKGVGKMLLAAAADAARNRGATRLFLEVAADNEAALALYEKDGFAPIGRRKAYYPRETGAADAVMLSRSL